MYIHCVKRFSIFAKKKDSFKNECKKLILSVLFIQNEQQNL